jgi:sirohydrochlorin ferrochelatase
MGDLVGESLVLAVHGTRSAAGQAVSAALRDAVAARLGHVKVVLGWADVLEPPLVETLRELGPCVLVPVFMTVGYHVAYDVPTAVRDSGGRAVVTPHVGDAILDAVAERLAEVDPEPEAVVLGAAGSLRPGSVAEVAAAAQRLALRLGCPVTPGFVASAEPSVRDAVAAARAAGARRVSIASYFLAPGVLPGRLDTAGADVVARPVGTHPHLVDAIVERFLAAVATGSAATVV